MTYPEPIASSTPTGTETEDDGLRIAAVAAPVRAQVVHNLREAILNRTFAPGRRLIERELCEMTGVSRTSIREALRQLETEGLVVMIPNRGPVVAEMTIEDARDLYEVRGVLEALASRRFARDADDTAMAGLQASVEQLADAVAQGAFAETLDRLADFYTVLLAGPENGVLRSVLQSLHQRITFMRTTSLARSGHSTLILQEIRALADAIARRDPELASQRCEEHVRHAAQRALETLRDTGV